MILKRILFITAALSLSSCLSEDVNVVSKNNLYEIVNVDHWSKPLIECLNEICTSKSTRLIYLRNSFLKTSTCHQYYSITTKGNLTIDKIMTHDCPDSIINHDRLLVVLKSTR